MRVGGMIIVVRAVEIGRHHRYIVSAILTVEKLAIFQSRDFGQGICLVGFLERGSEQAAFGHRLGSHAGIDARRPQKFQFPATVAPGRVNHIHLENHVVVHEIGQGVLVGDYASHLGSRKKHIFRLLLGEKLLHCLLTAEVEFLMRAGDDVGVALTAQFAHNGRPYHTAVPGNIDFRCQFHHFTIPFSRYSARFMRTF